MKLAEDITLDEKDEYLDLIAEGDDPKTAANKLGYHGSAFRSHRRPNSIHFDRDFADRFATIYNSEERKQGQIERVRSMVWAEAEEGNWRAIEKLAYAHLPEFEKLRHSNLRVTGEVYHQWRAILPHLSDEELQARIEEAQGKPVALLEAPQAA